MVSPFSAFRLSPRRENGTEPPSGKRYSQNDFRLSLYGLVLTTLKFAMMSCGPVEEYGKLDAIDYLASQIKQKLRYSRFLTSFARTDGHDEEIDVETRTSANFDLRRELLDGRADGLARADFRPWYFH